MDIKIKDLVLRRLKNQQLLNSSFRKPEEVVRRMLAMQAQDFFAALLAIGLRINPTEGIDQEKVEQAANEGRIVRSWPMRGTLHFLAPEDVRWMLRLLTPRVIKSSAGRYRELELDDAVFNKSRNIFENSLQGGKQLTRTELYEFLEREGISTAGQRGIHIIGHLAQQELICFGAKKDKQHTFVLLDEWVPKSTVLEGEEALFELTGRYFKSHGPATEYDFASWSGMKVSDARRGIDMRSDLPTLKVEDKTYWFSESTETADSDDGPNEVLLLPAFDEMLCGYKDRSSILRSEDVKSAILKNGIVSPTILFQNQIIGTWRRDLKKDSIVFEPSYFQKTTKAIEKMVQLQAVQKVGDFLKKEVLVR